MTKSFSEGTRWWTLLVGVVEINMIKLSFNCFLQFHLLASFTSKDKINLLLNILCLFLLLLYCLCFYFLIYKYERKHYARYLLTKTKFGFKSFIFESSAIVSRNFIRAFIHASLIGHHRIQISLLTLTDFIYLVLNLLMYNRFDKKIIGVLSIIYSFVLFLFDLFFCIKVNVRSEFIQRMDPFMPSLILILFLVFDVLLTCMILIFLSVKETLFLIINSFCKKIKPRNARISVETKNSSANSFTAHMVKKKSL